MKIFKKHNVFDEALERIRFLFDEFQNIIVNFSGGKDSTVIFNLALIVAKEKNRLPLKVCFIDQEAEWQATIDHVKEIMYRDDVEPYWYQMPLRISNATSYDEQWLYCWKEGEQWIREKDPISIKKNVYGTLSFLDLFEAINYREYGKQKVARLNGIRAEESPKRFLASINGKPYKWITWLKHESKKLQHFAFYPIYDWSYTDIWKAIHDNNWSYCKIYDYMYQYGVSTRNMRVSNLHHETAIKALFFMQEIEPNNYNRLISRLKGINTIKLMQNDAITVKELPFMFESWKEYRDYLLENLINNNEQKQFFKHKFQMHDKRYGVFEDKLYRSHINVLLTNDYHNTKLHNIEINYDRELYKIRQTSN